MCMLNWSWLSNIILRWCVWYLSWLLTCVSYVDLHGCLACVSYVDIYDICHGYLTCASYVDIYEICRYGIILRWYLCVLNCHINAVSEYDNYTMSTNSILYYILFVRYTNCRDCKHKFVCIVITLLVLLFVLICYVDNKHYSLQLLIKVI